MLKLSDENWNLIANLRHGDHIRATFKTIVMGPWNEKLKCSDIFVTGETFEISGILTQNAGPGGYSLDISDGTNYKCVRDGAGAPGNWLVDITELNGKPVTTN